MLTLSGHSGAVTAVAYSPAGRWLASAGWDGTVRLWDLHRYAEQSQVRTQNPHARAVAFSPDGRMLAAGFAKAPGDQVTPSLMFWSVGKDGDPIDGWERYRLEQLYTKGHSPVGSGVQSIVFDPDGPVLAVNTGNTQMLLRMPDLETSWVREGSALAFRRDGHFLATIEHIYGEVTVSLRDRRRGTQTTLHTEGGRQHGRSLTWAPDSSQLAVGIGPRIVLCAAPSQGPTVLQGHEDDVLGLAFTPDGKTLASASRDGHVIWWDVANRVERSRFDWQIGDVSSVAFAPDGLTVAAGGHGGEIVVWDVEG